MAAVDTALAPRMDGYAGPVVRGVLMSQLRDLTAPIVDLVVAVDDPGAWTTLVEGRLPSPCVDGASCEAVLLAQDAPTFDFAVARPAEGLALTIVGRGQIDAAVPFGQLDQRGPFGDRVSGQDYQTTRATPAVLLVNGVDALAASPALDRAGRTYVWTAPLAVGSIHPWTAASFARAVDDATRDLAAADSGFTIESPTGAIGADLARADAAQGRLLLIGSLGVAILLAFAVFLALVMRDDVAAESARLTAIGARRRDRLAFTLLEAFVPTVAGAAIGWALGCIVVAGIAATNGADAAAVVGGALLTPGSILTAVVLVLVATIAVGATTSPGLARTGSIRLAAAIGVTAVATLGWQAATSGPLDAGALGGSLASPVLVLLPAALAFMVALVAVTVLPPILRRLARRLRHAPLPIRLSLLSIAREPGRPAATLTLLAFSLGAIIFATGWSASLGRGIDDAAAYRSGLDLRVSELGTALSIGRSVVPVDRYGSLGHDIRTVPVYRDASPEQPGGRVDIVGIAPDVIPTLPGWRDDFSTTPVGTLAERLATPAPSGGWRVGGHRLPAGAPDLDLRFTYTGEPLRLTAVVVTDDGDSTNVPLGTITDGMTSARAALPAGARGGTLLALIFHNDRLVAGSGHQHEVFRATIAFDGLDGLVDEAPIDLEVFTVSTTAIVAPQPTDGLALPALVSPDLAASAAPDGTLDLHVGGVGTLPLRIVGTATRFPTVVDPSPRFIVVPLDPFLVALAAEVPGSGRPSEMWIDAPTPERIAEVRAALGRAPFRFAEMTDRAELVAARAGDPLSEAITATLVVAALAGLILAVGGMLLGAVTDLRDDRGELADLEAQGVSPSSLRWHAVARTAWLAVGGALSGLVVGLVLTTFATSALALTAEGSAPIPPLVVVIPVVLVGGVVVGVTVLVLGLVAWLASRTYARETLGERRAGPIRATTAPTVEGTDA